MITFLKAQAASLTATVTDFVVTVLLKELLDVWYLAASVTGTITGGVVNFLMGRNWVFAAADGKKLKQAMRYLLVWNGNLLLNAGGVYTATHYAGMQYVVSKVLVSLVVGFTYNYFLQKKYVFR